MRPAQSGGAVGVEAGGAGAGEVPSVSLLELSERTDGSADHEAQGC